MAVWRNCCCCSVKTASLVFSILGLIGYFGSVVWGVVNIINGVDYPEEYSDVFGAMDIASFVVTIIGILIYVALVYGVLKPNETFMMPMLIYEPLTMVYQMSILIAKAVIVGIEEYWIAYLVVVISTVATIIVRLVLWMVFYSYRKQIIEEKKIESQENLSVLEYK